MKLRPLKPVESRLAALGLLLLTLILAYFLLLHWWFVVPLRKLDTAMDTLRLTQVRYVSMIEQQPKLQRRLASLGQSEANNRSFLHEQDASVAVAALMQRVVDEVSAQASLGDCEVTWKTPSSEPSGGRNEPYRRVSADIRLHCQMRPLVGLLYTLEDGMPYLFISNFRLYRNPFSMRKKTDNGLLNVEFTLYGYMHAQSARSRGATTGAREVS